MLGACYVTALCWEPWFSEIVTLQLAHRSLGCKSCLRHRALGSLGAKSLLRHSSLLGSMELFGGSGASGWLLGVLLEPSWGPFGPSWSPFGQSRGFSEALGPLETLLRASWEPLGAFWGSPGAVLGPSWAFRSSPGAVLGPSWAVLVPSWTVFGPSGAVLEPSWRPLGPSWDDLWSLLGRLGQFLARTAENPKNRQKPMENQCF